ncbi:MAG: efflux RND transporter periplasmic adaptor subunit, partial [Planctomycetota bacterium]
RALSNESSEFNVENAKEELGQLEKMYEEDELVDETEQIVLRRARWNLKYRRASDELAKKRRAFAAEYQDRAHEERLRLDVERRSSALDQSRRQARINADSSAIDLARAENGFALKQRNLERLEADLAGLTVRAPASGILLHGRLEGALGRRFSPGAQVNAHEAAITIVDPSALVAVLSVPSKEVLRIAIGQSVEVDPTAEGAAPVSAVVTEAPALPRGGTLRVLCRPAGELPRSLLGHECEGKIAVGKLEAVLLLPLRAVRGAGENRWCLVARGMGDPEKVTVEIGPDDGERVVIEKGLAEGDEVVLPEEGK